MPISILMPALSPTMTEGNLARWTKAVGDKVKPGDVIAEIETDKATMEVEAVDEGRLGKILVPEGTQGVKVNAPIAILLEEGESEAALTAPAMAAPPKPAPAPAAAAPAQKAPAQPAIAAESKPGQRIWASPLARRLASAAGIDLARLTGSGPQGRIIRADIEKAKAGGTQAAGPMAPKTLPAAEAGQPGFGEAAFDLVPHTSMRKTIARRLLESKQQVPHFYLSVECDLDRLLAIREEINAALPKESSIKISVNDFIIAACAKSLIAVPAANASWSEAGTKFYKSADISVAVAIPGGLITPVLRHAEAKTLSQISAEMRDLAGRARAGKLKPEDYTGGTFSLSNLGMFGIKAFAAIVNPPQGCILAIGAGIKQPVVRKDEIAVATIMNATLSVDHRVVDGAIGAEFLAAFKRTIENPLTLLI